MDFIKGNRQNFRQKFKSGLVIFSIFLLVSACRQDKKQEIEKPVTLGDSIKTGTIQEAGMDETILSNLIRDIDTGLYPNRHSLLIYKSGKLVLEKYFSGHDEAWGDDLGIVTYNADSIHDLRSVSKSVVSACIGLAIGQGKIINVHQPIFDFFEEYKKYDTGMKSHLTLEHLLTMTSGLEWNEEVPYDHPENSEIQMIRSQDPVEYVLSRPMETEPGSKWKYNGGTTQLLSAILKKVTGMEADAFASTYLFKPLGISKFKWVQYPGTNIPAAASGLRLRPRDMLKFGILYWQDGKWDNQQLLPSGWVDSSFKSRVPRGEDGGYGYQFWTWSFLVDEKEVPVVAAVGNGDQRIIFDKGNDLLVVMTAGNYNKWDIKNDASAIMQKIYQSLTHR